MRLVYADNNATTQVAPEVLEAIEPYLRDCYFNPSSMYEPARDPGQALDRARRTVSDFFGGVRTDEVIFTSCATESNNATILGATRANPGRRHVITTQVEHPAVLNVCQELERDGFDVTYLPVDRSGRLAMEAFVKALRPGETLLVSVMHANNETGVVFPVADLARIVKETDPEILFHTDATQSVTKIPIDLTQEYRAVDLLSFSGHKIHAPKGVGALFVRRGAAWRPFLLGGHQERGRRAGTENVAFIVGLARALELAQVDREETEDRIRRLRDRLEHELVERIPFLEVNGREADRLPNTLNVACHFIEGEGILYQLSAAGICASSGSACTSGSLDPSHVLKAMKVPFTAVHGSVRFSFSRYTTKEDIDRIVGVFPGIVESLRRLSPYWDQSAGCPRPEGEALLQQAAS